MKYDKEKYQGMITYISDVPIVVSDIKNRFKLCGWTFEHPVKYWSDEDNELVYKLICYKLKQKN